MARVTAAEVLEIIDVDESISNINPFVLSGNLLVTNTLGGSTQLDEATLKEIERNVVAHLITSADPRAAQEKTEDISVKYEGNFGKYFESSRYGQVALMLDFTGALAKAGMKKASLGVVNYTDASSYSG